MAAAKIGDMEKPISLEGLVEGFAPSSPTARASDAATRSVLAGASSC